MSKLFVFHGADRRVGVSMLAQSTAELISRNRKDLKVLLVNLQGRYGTAYTGYIGENIEHLRYFLDNKLIDKEELISGCRCTDNLFILGGVDSIGEEHYYQPEMSSYLLSLIRDDFDLILADSGSDVDNGLALGALVMADEVLLIFTQQESVLARMEKLRALYNKLRLTFSFLVCNRYQAEDPYTKEYLHKRLGEKKDRFLFVAEGKDGRRAEVESKTLLSYNNSPFQADATEVANAILKKAGWQPIENRRKKDGTISIKQIFGEGRRRKGG